LCDRLRDVGFKTDQSTSLLVDGKAAMALGHNDIWLHAAKSSDPSIKDKIGFFLFPQKQKAFFTGCTMVAIAKNTKSPNEAFDLWKVLTSKDATLQNCELSGMIPPRNDLIDSDYAKNNKVVKFVMDNFDYIKNEGGPEAWLEIRANFGKTIEEAQYQRKTPEDALNELASFASFEYCLLGDGNIPSCYSKLESTDDFKCLKEQLNPTYDRNPKR
jgi:ABC-type glycerol-3-phosphate transport system substrate-binding protein